jgi:putative transcriptional regulator
MIAHHPSPDILAAYAAGALDSGFALVVAAHLEACDHCRGHVRAFEQASGAALADLPDAQLRSEAFAQTLSRLDERQREIAPVDPRPFLQRLPLKPRKWVAPGVWVAAVDTPHARDNRVYLLSVKPGMPTARHEHSGAEFCTVLQGAFRDETGRYAIGDFAAADDDLNHQPMVEPGPDCICLFATEGRLKPHGLIGRIAFAWADV